MNIPCPVCKTPLEPKAKICPLCGRKRDEIDIELGYRWLAEQRRRRLWHAFEALALAAVATAAIVARQRIARNALQVKSGFDGRVQAVIRASEERARRVAAASAIPHPSTWPKAPEEIAPIIASSVTPLIHLIVSTTAPYGVEVPPPHAVRGRPTVFAEAASARPPAAAFEEDEQASAPPPQPASMPEGTRRVYGRVYDLVTTKSVPQANVSVSHGSVPWSWKTRSAQGGWYAVDVPSYDDEEYLIAVEAEGYRHGQLRDVKPPYRSRAATARRRKAALTTVFALQPASLYLRDSEPVRVDLVVVPPEP